jgi:hypothetical protein
VQGGWNVRLSTAVENVKQKSTANSSIITVGGMKKIKDGYKWDAQSKERVDEPSGELAGFPGKVYRTFEGRITAAGKVWRFPTFEEYEASPDAP